MSEEALDGGWHRPILVTGMPRSGTTWVARMIEAGGRVGYLNEPFNLATDPGTLRVPVRRWFPYVTDETEGDVLPALGAMLRYRYPLGRELRKCRSRTDVLHTLKWWWSFRTSRGRRPLVKEPHAVFSADWFARRLGSDVVITVRHPAAVVSSWKRLDWSFDFGNLLGQPALLRDLLAPLEPEMRAALEPSRDRVDRVALLWRVVYQVVDGYRGRFPEFAVVRQEDLSRDPGPGFARLYERLGLPFTKEAAAAVSASSGAGNPAETPVDRPHETRLDSAANLENWRSRLTSDEIDRVRGLTEDVAARFYSRDDW